MEAKGTQEWHGMRVSDQRSPMGRKLLPKTSRRQPKEIQCVRQDTRRMRSGACQDDRTEEKGNLRTQEKSKNGITHRGATVCMVAPQKLRRRKQRKGIFKRIEKKP